MTQNLEHQEQVDGQCDKPSTLLGVDDMAVDFRLRRPQLFASRPVLRAVDGVSFRIAPAETLGLVGESGSGKSTTGRAALRLEQVTRGRIVFDGQDITELETEQLRPIRRHMSMVFQDPYGSLDPSMIVANIVGEPLDTHERLSRAERRERIQEALEKVHLRPEHLKRYPYEFSGGQRQRIAIARATVLRPKLVVADEAVSSLDVSTQSQVINLFQQLQAELGIAYLFIAHDLALVQRVSDRVAVMYLGRIVESGPSDDIAERPAHPYTAALNSAVPYPQPRIQRERERVILRGDQPSPVNPPAGCRFHTRCPWVMDICREQEPEHTPLKTGGSVACHLQHNWLNLKGDPLPTLAPEGHDAWAR